MTDIRTAQYAALLKRLPQSLWEAITVDYVAPSPEPKRALCVALVMVRGELGDATAAVRFLIQCCRRLQLPVTEVFAEIAEDHKGRAILKEAPERIEALMAEAERRLASGVITPAEKEGSRLGLPEPTRVRAAPHDDENGVPSESPDSLLADPAVYLKARLMVLLKDRMSVSEIEHCLLQIGIDPQAVNAYAPQGLDNLAFCERVADYVVRHERTGPFVSAVFRVNPGVVAHPYWHDVRTAKAVVDSADPGRLALDEKGTYWFYVVDIVGFTAIVEQEGNKRGSDVVDGVIRVITELTRDLDPRHEGEIGDCYWMTLRTSDDLAQTAVDIIEQVENGVGVQLHTAVHVGEAILRGRLGGNPLGGGVNVAFRLVERCPPGCIVFSNPAWALIGTRDVFQNHEVSRDSFEPKNMGEVQFVVCRLG